MASITRGKTFGATETVTNTKLHQLVDSATIASIASTDFDLTTTNPIHIGSSAPSDSNSKFWYDTTNNLFLVKDASGTFQPQGRGAEYTNKSGVSVAAGDVLILDTSNAQAVKTTTSANSLDAWGVAVSSAANDAVVYVVTEGLVAACSVDGATSIGDYLYTSTTTKKATPSSTVASGAFARALTSDSSSVVAYIFPTVYQDVPGSDTFEIEAGREAIVSTNFASPTTVTFGTAFSKPPIVVCTPESTTAADVVIVKEVTTTNFTAYGDVANAFNWVACTAGTYEVKSGVVIQAGSTAMPSTDSGDINSYQTGETPAIVCGGASCDDAASGLTSFNISGRLFGGGTTSNLNGAGNSSNVAVTSAGVSTDDACVFLLVSQTGAVQTGNTATAAGAQDTIGSLSFESGTVLECSSVTPTLTFQTAFSAAPAVIVGGESRDQNFTSSNWPANLNAVPTTTAITGRLTTTDSRTGFNWIAFEKGHETVTTAKRLG